jgi:hypothetical protein
MPAAMLQPGTPGNLTQVGGHVKLTTVHGNLDSDMQVSFRDGSKALGGSIRDWLIAKVIEAGIDSYNAAKASDEAIAKTQISANTEAAKIASAEKIQLEKLALEAAEITP